MKVRFDFVTNSSSSSFILAFADCESIEKTIHNENIDGYTEDRINTLIHDIKREEISKEKAITIFTEEMRDWFMWTVASKRKYQKYRWEQLEKSKEFMDEVNSKLDKAVLEFTQKINSYGYFTEVSYSDHGDGDLEHLCYNLNCTVGKFSHH